MSDVRSPGGLGEILERHGFTYNHRLGQNFLVDRGVLAAIARESRARVGDHVVEVGAGAGALTIELAARAACVVAVEVDRRLEGVLAEVLARHSNALVLQADIRKTDLDELFGRLAETFGPPAGARRVVGNLPYYITTPVLTGFLEGLPRSRRPWETLTVTVQKEVADRLLAGPGSKEYGALTLLAAYHAVAAGGPIIPPRAFRPSPKVSSRVVTLTRRPTPPVEADREILFRLIRAGFGQRRKMLANALSILTKGRPGPAADWSVIAGEAGIDPRRRAETLSLDEFAALARTFETFHQSGRAPSL